MTLLGRRFPHVSYSSTISSGLRIQAQQKGTQSVGNVAPNFEVYVSNCIILIDFSYSYVSEIKKAIQNSAASHSVHRNSAALRLIKK